MKKENRTLKAKVEKIILAILLAIILLPIVSVAVVVIGDRILRNPYLGYEGQSETVLFKERGSPECIFQGETFSDNLQKFPWNAKRISGVKAYVYKVPAIVNGPHAAIYYINDKGIITGFELCVD